MKSLNKFTRYLLYSLLLIAFTACNLPTATPAATAVAPQPSQKFFFDRWEYGCDSNGLTFKVTWRDRTADELGYRIFRNGEKIAELPPNSTSYADTFNPPAGESVEYYVQVFGPSGTENTSVMRMSC